MHFFLPSNLKSTPFFLAKYFSTVFDYSVPAHKTEGFTIIMVQSYLIGYDLDSPGQDYTKLIDHIKEKYPTYWHHLDSTWIVRTDLTAVEIRDDLKDYIDSNDELLVAKLSGAAAWTGIADSGSKWLTNNL